MTSSSRSGARVLLFSAAAGGLAAAACVVGGFVSSLGIPFLDSTDVPFATSAGALLLAGTPLLARASAGAARPWVAAGLAVTPPAALLFLSGMYTLGRPIVVSHWRCGTGEAAMFMTVPFVFALVGAVGGVAAALFAGRSSRWAGSALRAGALVGAAVLSVLLAWSGARVATRPAPGGYPASLPVAVTLPPTSGAPQRTSPHDDGSSELDGVFVDRLPGFDLELTRRCLEDSCSYTLARPGTPDPTTPDGRLIYAEGGRVGRGQPVIFRRDEAHRLWVVEGSGTAAYREEGDRVTLVDIHARDVSDAISPPPGWVAGAAGATLLAALIERRRRRVAAKLARVEAARPGLLGDDGRVTFEDETPAARVDQAGLKPGPVLVTGDRPTAGGYRGEGQLAAGAVLEGERAAWVERLLAEIASLDALMLAAVALAAAPLLAAWSQL